jgi:hypothetical protein
MLDPQIVVNFFPQVCVCMGLAKHNHYLFGHLGATAIA